MSYTPVDPGPGLALGLAEGRGLAFALAGLGPANLSVNFFFGAGGAIEPPFAAGTGLGAGGLALRLVIPFGVAFGGALKLVSDGGGLPAKPVGEASVGAAPPDKGEEAGAVS